MATEQRSEVAADLVFLLSQASHALTTELTAGLAQLGISPRHYCVLSRAVDSDLTQIHLAELCGMDRSTMVVTIDELERIGLAKRRPSSTDRRARIISVTPAGRRKIAAAQRIVAGIYDDVLANLPERERGPFVDSLARLVNGRLASPVRCETPVRRPAFRAAR